MTKKQFKKRWESNNEGGGITYEDVADCAKKWGISSSPMTCGMPHIRYEVLKAARVKNYEDFKPG